MSITFYWDNKQTKPICERRLLCQDCIKKFYFVFEDVEELNKVLSPNVDDMTTIWNEYNEPLLLYQLRKEIIEQGMILISLEKSFSGIKSIYKKSENKN